MLALSCVARLLSLCYCAACLPLLAVLGLKTLPAAPQKSLIRPPALLEREYKYGRWFSGRSPSRNAPSAKFGGPAGSSLAVKQTTAVTGLSFPKDHDPWVSPGSSLQPFYFAGLNTGKTPTS